MNPAAARKTMTRIMRAIPSWRCLAERAERVVGELARRTYCCKLCLCFFDPGFGRSAHWRRKSAELGHCTRKIAMLRLRVGARHNGCGIISRRLVDRADAHQPFGILLDAIEN